MMQLLNTHKTLSVFDTNKKHLSTFCNKSSLCSNYVASDIFYTLGRSMDYDNNYAIIGFLLNIGRKSYYAISMIRKKP